MLRCGCGQEAAGAAALVEHFTGSAVHRAIIRAAVRGLDDASTAVTLGMMQPGGWCPACLLPSQVAVPLYVIGADGPVQVGEVRICEKC